MLSLASARCVSAIGNN